MTPGKKRTGLPEEVMFPVTPFLDMAFQLLAFFILTFRPPSNETRLELYLPTAPAALPQSPRGQVQAPSPDDPDLETDLVVRAEAGPGGEIATLKLGETPLSGTADLESRLRSYAALLNGRPLRVRLEAPDSIRYGEAARLIGSCSAAGVSSVRLAGPSEAGR